MHVGMNRHRRPPKSRAERVPHARGDEPEDGSRVTSPHIEFPMHVGMNRD